MPTSLWRIVDAQPRTKAVRRLSRIKRDSHAIKMHVFEFLSSSRPLEFTLSQKNRHFQDAKEEKGLIYKLVHKKSMCKFNKRIIWASARPLNWHASSRGTHQPLLEIHSEIAN